MVVELKAVDNIGRGHFRKFVAGRKLAKPVLVEENVIIKPKKFWHRKTELQNLNLAIVKIESVITATTSLYARLNLIKHLFELNQKKGCFNWVSCARFNKKIYLFFY